MAATNEVCDPKFWESICPSLTLTPDPSAYSESTSAPELHELDNNWSENLIHEGYLNLPGAFPQERIHALRAAVDTMVSRNLPPVFATVYDEF